MNMTVREADATLLPSLLAIENVSFTCPWSEESFRAALESEAVRVTVCEDDAGECAGFACLMTVADEGELLNIACSPDRRRQGVAQRLMDDCAAYCIRSGVSVLYLEVRESNAAARSLYRKNGFLEIGVRRNYYEKPRENAVLMRRVLVPELEGYL